MKSLIIFIVSFIVLCASANENATSTESGLSSTSSGGTITSSEGTITSSEGTITSSEGTITSSEAPICGPNEVYKICSCRLKDLCINRFFNKPCLRCKPGCMCCEGYRRRRLGSPCRPEEECGIFKN